MRSKINTGILVLGLMLISGSAFADWGTRVEDDAFSDGHTAMMFGAEIAMRGIAFDCSNDTLSVSYIEQADTKDVVDGIPADLVLKVDKNPSVKLKAQTVARNSDYLGVKADNADELKVLLAQLKQAKRQVLVGVRFPDADKKMSFTLNTVGSTTAVNKFIKACNIDLPALDTKKK
ncbi:hypothetical protein NFS79_004575 [Salmonella enterica]|nr:hypothetical protein [Salmonella enterica subsp. enterica serovar Muenchen]EFS5969287.1 hypothetical protein [Salmonella enterica]EFT9846209.1 hypothetical protein [Salmonella enterica]EFU0047237.1 hypothetical protein [Salmonella enterica]EFV5168225.1 hypothetical protein [Salmonella enterica]